jgi:hypothetical protein
VENIFAVPGSFFKCKYKVYRTIFKQNIKCCFWLLNASNKTTDSKRKRKALISPNLKG